MAYQVPIMNKKQKTTGQLTKNVLPACVCPSKAGNKQWFQHMQKIGHANGNCNDFCFILQAGNTFTVRRLD